MLCRSSRGAQAPAPAPRASSAALKTQAQPCRRTSCHLLGLGLPPPAGPCALEAAKTPGI